MTKCQMPKCKRGQRDKGQVRHRHFYILITVGTQKDKSSKDQFLQLYIKRDRLLQSDLLPTKTTTPTTPTIGSFTRQRGWIELNALPFNMMYSIFQDVGYFFILPLEVNDVFQHSVFGKLNIHKFNLFNQMNCKNQPWSAFIEKVQLSELSEPLNLLLISGKCTNLSRF